MHSIPAYGVTKIQSRHANVLLRESSFRLFAGNMMIFPPKDSCNALKFWSWEAEAPWGTIDSECVSMRSSRCLMATQGAGLGSWVLGVFAECLVEEFDFFSCVSFVREFEIVVVSHRKDWILWSLWYRSVDEFEIVMLTNLRSWWARVLGKCQRCLLGWVSSDESAELLVPTGIAVTAKNFHQSKIII